MNHTILALFFVFLSSCSCSDWMMDLSELAKNDGVTQYVLAEDMQLEDDYKLASIISKTLVSDVEISNEHDSLLLMPKQLSPKDLEMTQDLRIIPKGSILSVEKLYLNSVSIYSAPIPSCREIYFILAQIHIKGLNERVFMPIHAGIHKPRREDISYRSSEFYEISNKCLINPKTGKTLHIKLPEWVWENKSLRQY